MTTDADKQADFERLRCGDQIALLAHSVKMVGDMAVGQDAVFRKEIMELSKRVAAAELAASGAAWGVSCLSVCFAGVIVLCAVFCLVSSWRPQ